MTDDCKLSPGERVAFQQRLDRRPPVPLLSCVICGLQGLDPDDKYSAAAQLHTGDWVCSSACWEEAAKSFDGVMPCPAGCSQGRVVVPVRDGTFGFVMTPCENCSRQQTEESHGEPESKP